MRYSIHLSYDGSEFCGWQIQPGEPTIQKSLEDALSTLLRTRISVTGAGRTDTGVNAVGYTAHFDCDSAFNTSAIRCKLNAILPHSIYVHGIKEEADDFHSRFGASNREYTYFLHTKKDPFVEKFSFLCTYPLDFEAMNRAAAKIPGTRDFSCFEKTGTDTKTPICTVRKAEWCRYTPDHVALMGYEGGEYYYFKIEADRFLRNMVRAIVGTLIEVGRGKRTPEQMLELFESRNRCAAGESVPGHALFLSGIDY